MFSTYSNVDYVTKNIAEAFKINLDRQDWYELYSVSRGEL